MCFQSHISQMNLDDGFVLNFQTGVSIKLLLRYERVQSVQLSSLLQFMFTLTFPLKCCVQGRSQEVSQILQLATLAANSANTIVGDLEIFSPASLTHTSASSAKYSLGANLGWLWAPIVVIALIFH